MSLTYWQKRNVERIAHDILHDHNRSKSAIRAAYIKGLKHGEPEPETFTFGEFGHLRIGKDGVAR